MGDETRSAVVSFALAGFDGARDQTGSSEAVISDDTLSVGPITV